MQEPEKNQREKKNKLVYIRRNHRRPERLWPSEEEGVIRLGKKAKARLQRCF